jgi:O-antigen/teichoic acid export membrane protein
MESHQGCVPRVSDVSKSTFSGAAEGDPRVFSNDVSQHTGPAATGLLRLSTHARSFARRMEMDRAVSYAILTRLWTFISGPVSAILIATKFSQTLQGFYYTFGSILALQTFAELGIGVAITQFASHEWSNLRVGANGRIEGDQDSLSRLASLTHIAIKWYAVVALIVICGLSVSGYVFFMQSPSQDVSWKLPWISLCILSGINLFTIAVWSLLEGCNQVSNVYLYRLFNSVAATVVVWLAIFLDANLWTAAIMTAVSLGYAGLFLRRSYWEFFKTLLQTKPQGARVSWRTDILPFQWRIAVSWISGYFIFSLFTPVLFHYQGPVVAGQMGMTWSLVSVISAIGSAWISPRIPQFGMLIAQKRFGELDRLFWRLTVIVTGVAILGATALWCLVLILNQYHHRLASRLLPPLPTALFLLATIVYTASGTMTVYLRAHKREPLLFVSVLLGVVVGLSTWLLGKTYGAVGVGAGYLAAYTMIFPVIAFVWQHSRREWHGDEAGWRITG